MKFQLSLSSKATGGHKQIMLRFSPTVGNKRLNMRAKSEVFVSEEYFDPNEESGISKSKISAKRIPSPDVQYHREQKKRMEELIAVITMMYEQQDKATMTNDWLAKVVYEAHHPFAEEEKQVSSFEYLAEQYHNRLQVEQVKKNWGVLTRTVLRYEGFVRATERKDFVFDLATITSDDIEGLRDYITNEKLLSEEYPTLFAKLLQQYPSGKAGRTTITERGGNTVYDRMKKLRAFVNWCRKEMGIENDPYNGVTLGKEHNGTPIYITVNERKQLSTAMMPTEHLETQRDIFVFQSLIGCRVSDLTILTEDNICDRILVYTPQKTKDETAIQARVPLLDEAVSLIEKYRGKDRRGRLFPFISDQQYNKAIKEAFTIAGITRKVEWRNPLTGDMEFRPINEIASSHMARRTFVGNVYFNVPDPNLIGKMSGHKEGSRAFARYRKVEDETLANVVNLIK